MHGKNQNPLSTLFERGTLRERVMRIERGEFAPMSNNDQRDWKTLEV